MPTMKIKQLGSILSIVIILVIVGWFAFRNAAFWLVVSDPPPQSVDALFTFAGENARITYSKKLFSEDSTALWMLSYPSNKIAIPLAHEGLDTSRIYVVDTCKNTKSEVAFILSRVDSIVREHISHSGKMKELHQRDYVKTPFVVGLVSTPYHMRRIQLLVAKHKANKCVELCFLPVPFDRYGWTKNQYATWWKNKTLRSNVFLEYKKLFYYFWT
jgi:hypothetical protein